LGQSASATTVGAAGPANPAIEELTAAVEQEANKRPDVLLDQRLARQNYFRMVGKNEAAGKQSPKAPLWK
jgi:hypothetical protein